ncbi:hypothetical protein [Paracoccus shanxieyensis]|uniref:Uncharacterized protein n=1 Tax=Paracoccus shanxieyensis TaxID=2675752 RepID=A0A6L6IS69_9RHOB|nr:hypothetical protein [Paracoccus shanxieyensis]MTH63335.1 hypothetical protein [Paracoccus shanxieyensis]MTH87249.1 hypothetical protein [Paracoccus shanxieyensis]
MADPFAIAHEAFVRLQKLGEGQQGTKPLRDLTANAQRGYQRPTLHHIMTTTPT